MINYVAIIISYREKYENIFYIVLCIEKSIGNIKLESLLIINMNNTKNIIQTEQEMISLLKDGDERAYRHIYKHHYVVLCQFAESYLNDSFLAECIVQDIIFHIWEKRDTLEIHTSLRSYLMRAVRNRCLNYLELNSEKYEVSFSNLPLETLDRTLFYNKSDNHPLGRLLEKELESEIQKAIKAIPLDSRRVFKKSRFENKKNEEIADELGISVNTVKYHIKKSLSVMRRILNKYLIILVAFYIPLIP